MIERCGSTERGRKKGKGGKKGEAWGKEKLGKDREQRKEKADERDMEGGGRQDRRGCEADYETGR